MHKILTKKLMSLGAYHKTSMGYFEFTTSQNKLLSRNVEITIPTEASVFLIDLYCCHLVVL